MMIYLYRYALALGTLRASDCLFSAIIKQDQTGGPAAARGPARCAVDCGGVVTEPELERASPGQVHLCFVALVHMYHDGRL